MKKFLQNRIKEIYNQVLVWIIENILPSLIGLLKSWENKLLKKFVWKKSILNLAPKILTGDALERIKPYLNSIEAALENEDVRNIALTGAYGSGKSSILRTFQHNNPQHKYLNICLASFNNEEGSHNVKSSLLEQLEASILQQIIYHVKPSEIPASRFKKTINIGFGKSVVIFVGVVFWIVSLSELCRHRYFTNGFTWNTFLVIETPISLILFLLGLLMIAPKILTLLANLKISKVDVKKGAIEFSANTEKSILNQHIDEILYFFERTQYNVVIIEDLDRFHNTQIFIKVREINTLINNYKAIKRKISFLYAVKDELLQDKSDRVKFFDLIIPVIPFVDPRNAGEQLKKLRSENNLSETDLSNEFLEDISLFINDIDMRLLTNIFHEYLIYRAVHKENTPNLNQMELFAAITYKNLFPKDFANLHKREGKLYEFFSNKPNYIQEKLSEKEHEIINLREQIKDIDNEKISSIEELRMIYVQKLINSLCKQNTNTNRNFIQPIFTIENTPIDFQNVTNNDENFSKLLNAGLIKINQYNQYNPSSGNPLSGSFTDTEKQTYEFRLNLIKSKAINEKNKHKQEIEKLNKEINNIKLQKIKDIFKDCDFDGYLDEELRKALIRYLIRKGYINENYHDYISLFHDVTMTKFDDAFLRHVKSSSEPNFEHDLVKVDDVNPSN